MKASIKINELGKKGEKLERITISGAKNKKEALEAAEAWCDENNCLLQDISTSGNSKIKNISSFTVKVCTKEVLSA